MTHNRKRQSFSMPMIRHAFHVAALALLVAGTSLSSAWAQDGGRDGLFGGLFNRSDRQDRGRPPEATGAGSASEADLIVRLDRLENALRQLTGTVEQLQYRNQQLEQQLRQMQESAGLGGGARPGAVPAAPPPRTGPLVTPGFPPPSQAVQPSAPGRRSDAFDPAVSPSAPGAPRPLGNPSGAPIIQDDAQLGPPIGAPGSRQAGAPLDLNAGGGDPSMPQPVAGAGLPPPPPRTLNSTGAQMAAVQPPSQLPKDEFDLGYGYVQRKDYIAAEETLRAFLRKYPTDPLAADANYWLGEALFQRQRYRDAAEAFLTVTTKFETRARAPDALLRLGQSLAALGEREAACAALGEVGRKYPKASTNVKQGVAAAQKRGNC
jgi:tol-pal system protein YbgF